MNYNIYKLSSKNSNLQPKKKNKTITKDTK